MSQFIIRLDILTVLKDDTCEATDYINIYMYCNHLTSNLRDNMLQKVNYTFTFALIVQNWWKTNSNIGNKLYVMEIHACMKKAIRNFIISASYLLCEFWFLHCWRSRGFNHCLVPVPLPWKLTLKGSELLCWEDQLTAHFLMSNPMSIPICFSGDLNFSFNYNPNYHLTNAFDAKEKWTFKPFQGTRYN